MRQESGLAGRRGQNGEPFSAVWRPAMRSRRPLCRAAVTTAQYWEPRPTAAAPTSSDAAPASRGTPCARLATRALDAPPAAQPPKHLPRQLTASIKATRHWTQLQRLFLDCFEQLNDIHVTAVATHLAKLVQAAGVAPDDRPQLFQFAAAVLECAAQRAHTLDARGCANCLWAVAALQSAAPHASTRQAAVVGALLSAAGGAMCELRPQEASNLMWACAVLGRAPPQPWMQRFERGLVGAPLGSVAPVRAGSAPRACGGSGSDGGDGALAVAAPAPVSSRGGGAGSRAGGTGWAVAMTSQEVANVLWALARLQLRPGGQAQEALLHRLAHHTPTMSAGELVTAAWALARARALAPLPWVAAYCARLEACMERLRPRDVSNTLATWAAWAAAAGACPPTAPAASPSPQLRRRLLAHMHRLLPAFDARTLADALHALGKDATPPPPALLRACVQRSGACAAAPGAGPLALASLACALARLRPLPTEGDDRVWLQEIGAAAARWAPRCRPRELSTLSWALGQLHGDRADGEPSPWAAAWVEAAEGASAARWAAFNGQDLAMLALGLGRLGAAAGPSAGWQAALLDACAAQLPSASPRTRATLLCAVARLGAQPGAAWWATAESAWEQGASDARAASAADAAMALWALACLRQPANCRLVGMQLTLLLLCAEQRGLRMGDAATALWALAQLRARPPPGSVAQLLCLTTPALAARPSGPHATNRVVAALWAAHRLQQCPPQPWLDAAWAHLRPQLQRLSGRTLATVLSSFAALGAAPEGDAGWLGAACAALQPRLHTLAPRELAAVVWSLAQLRAFPGSVWVDRAAGALGGQVLALGPCRTVHVLNALARLGYAAQPPWLQPVLAALRQQRLTLAQLDLLRGALLWWGVPVALLPPPARERQDRAIA